jgi:putative PIN family toxin of toxin-antitoxin system
LRVVFDTNVFVSALAIPGGQAERALRRVVDGTDHLLVSKAMISELVGVLGRKFARDAEELSRVALFVADLGEVVEPSRRVSVLPDEGDNRVLECALGGAADLVVTGDREMLRLGECEGIRIITLREYLQTRA